MCVYNIYINIYVYKHIHMYANENTYTYIYMCRCIIYIYNRRRERDVFLKYSLFERGVGVYLYCVCLCTHTHTLHVGLLNLSPGVGTRHTKSSHTKSSERPDWINLGSTGIRNTQINISLLPKKQRKKSEGDIETSNPAGFEQIDPTGRVLDYLGK